ncbi:BES1/BZR1 like protein 4 [Apostasia shenzhenica]|uniref:Protein BZR1 homolog n=1 Tax=Apostasia shenzhenica TaxID=1088818 RepID=A0A2I0B9I0_9ASPA|nr:BES1/BZR1 like protein 4 [Apostasia shenzhenica]
MTSGTRLPTWKERENNKRRERRRRAIAAKIYAGLRMYGNYKLPKHCDNNEVLKALCNEAGWIVEPDGTTYRKGCKPQDRMEIVGGGSASASPCSSYHPSPCASYNPSPASSSFPSPASSYITHAHRHPTTADADPNSLIPWLKNLSSSSSSASSLHNLYIHHGCSSAPVSPPLSSPRIKSDWDEPSSSVLPSWPPGSSPFATFLPNSTPASPVRNVIPDPAWLNGIRLPAGGPASPTFSLVSTNPFGVYREGVASAVSSRMWTPGHSGMCSPVAMPPDVQMSDCASDEFAFGSCIDGKLQLPLAGVVKPWEGERIHEECGSDDLELTLGSSRTRADA